MKSKSGPAHALVGMKLASGWTLTAKLGPGGSSGGNFGVGYLAESGEEKAFVKAIDFVEALSGDDPLRKLAELTNEANFERDAMSFCGDQRMSKVVRLIGHEYVDVVDPPDPLKRVFCLIMEIGDGDLRKQLKSGETLQCSAALSVLRDIALGLDQLHRSGISHQDVKPSNVIAMSELKQTSDVDMKLTDLGRVVRKDVNGPFDRYPWPGDPQYMPPECWYGYAPAEWTDRREASDAYMLGSLLFFLFTLVPLQPQLVTRIPPAYLPGIWRGGYDPSVIAVHRDAQVRTIAEALRPALPRELAEEIETLAKDLTEPDPSRRGDRRARMSAGRPVGIDRFHQRFRDLAIRAAILERVKRA